jgi:tetratricopeptide (TPR) repeat protein
MGKISFLSALLVSTSIFISCSPLISSQQSLKTPPSAVISATDTTTYGAYLAGRVAHIRKDFDSAADYYKLAVQKDPTNVALLTRLYLLLTSKGRIDEAADYAKQVIALKKGNDFALLLVAAQDMHRGNFEASADELKKIKDPIYTTLIIPLLNAWNYAGMGDQKKAFNELNKLRKEPSFKNIFALHTAMLHDFFGQNREATEAYEKILADKNAEISVRMLDLITNFYIRTGQKDKAVAIMQATINNQALDTLLASLRRKTIEADPQKTKPILSTAQVGAAEAVFTIASTFRYEDVLDIAHMYTALAVYMNPQYSTAKVLMADIFENRGMYEDANQLYDTIDKTDIAYFAAQMKKIRNLNKMEDYKGAEILLESLEQDYDDLQIYMELGDILRLNNRFTEAVEYYDKALKKAKTPVNRWVLLYAKGVSLDRAGQWKEAEKALLEAYDIKPHYLVLNHLGYGWIRQKQNVEQAFDMIVEAYNQNPTDPSINDSLGFALYNLGHYDLAVPYLEQAVELYPSSALISSHLGDAYWYAKRRNEARFQWKHALTLKDDSGELNIKQTQKKIENGLPQEPNLTFDADKIEESIKKIQTPSEKPTVISF